MLRDKTSICSKKRDSSEGTLLARTPSKHGPGFLRTSAAKNLNRDVNQTLIIDEESLNLSQYPLQQTVHQRHQDRRMFSVTNTWNGRSLLTESELAQAQRAVAE
jgi:hypothetical protein